MKTFLEMQTLRGQGIRQRIGEEFFNHLVHTSLAVKKFSSEIAMIFASDWSEFMTCPVFECQRK